MWRLSVALPLPQDTIYIHRYMYSMYDRPLASKPKPFIFYLVLVVGSCGANFSKVPCSCEMKLPVLRIWGIPRTCMFVCVYVFWPEVAIPALNAYKFNLVFCGTSSPAASVAFVVLSCFVILFVLAKNKPGVRSTESSRSNIYILAWLNTLAVDFRPRIALV